MVLSECISIKIVEDIEGIFDLNLEYPLLDTKNLSQYLVRGNIIKSPIWGTRGDQLFKIRTRTINTNTKRVSIYAQCIARTDLSTNFVPGVRVLAGQTRNQAITTILSSCAENQGYTVGNLDTNTNTSINLGLEADTGNVINYLDVDAISPLEGMLGDNKSVKSAYGGEIIYNNKEINMVDERGLDNNFIISSGKNLQELEQEISDIDTDNFATALTMQSSDGLYLPNQEIIYSPTGKIFDRWFYKKIICDDVTAVNETQEAINLVYAQLRERASNKWDEGINKLKINNTVNFIQLANTEEYKDYAQLEKCELGNNVTIKYSKIGLETTGRVIKITFNPLANDGIGKIEEVEIGDRKKKSIVDTITTTSNNVADIKNTTATNTSDIKKVASSTTDAINNLQVVMQQNDDSIELSVTNLATNTTAKFLVQDGQISSKVSNDTFNSAITQQANSIASKVSTGDFSSLIEQHYDSIVQAIIDATGSHTCTFNSSGLTIQNGGFVIKNSNGNTVLWMDTKGYIKVTDLIFDNAAFASDSNFANALANMQSITLAKLRIGGQLIIDEHDFYLYKDGDSGYNLESYVNARITEFCERQGWTLV